MLQDAVRYLAIAIGGVIVVATGVVIGNMISAESIRPHVYSAVRAVLMDVEVRTAVVHVADPIEAEIVDQQRAIEVFTVFPVEVTTPLGQPLSVNVENN